MEESMRNKEKPDREAEQAEKRSLQSIANWQVLTLT